MGWSWITFLIGFPIMTFISMFSRGAMNAANVEKYGAEGDWRADKFGAMTGSAIAGGIFASILAVIIGSLF